MHKLPASAWCILSKLLLDATVPTRPAAFADCTFVVIYLEMALLRPHRLYRSVACSFLQRLKHLVAEEAGTDKVALRLTVEAGGCSGFSYK